MTEQEIMKALELCHTMDGSVSCYDCPCWNDERQRCDGFDHTDLLDLINRKNAEIERLNGYLDVISYSTGKIKAEATKEFVKRAKRELSFGKYIQPDQIDQIAKEMGVEL